ncbi:MAG: signal peptidase I [Oscillospiraceae bacterium]|nr:signal peptidase I [Oscillospiraceae bacterium]
MKKIRSKNRPSVTEIQDELDRLRQKRKRSAGLRYTIILSLLMSALLIVATNLWFPVLRVSGSSMQPLLKNEDVILCLDTKKDIGRGNIIAFYHNDKILLRRVIGIPGDSIEIDPAGVVTVNGTEQLETYASVLSLEPCDIAFPVKVPEDCYFVMGDQRVTAMDSRTETIGMIRSDQLIGKALFRVWPFDTFTPLQ